MRKFGLIGYPLTHSFSKKYFEEKFAREKIPDCQYDLYPINEIGGLPQLLHENPELAGLNVTIPYKETVIQYLDMVEQTADDMGAVNCIAFDGKMLIGFNTDEYGFRHSLSAFLTGKPGMAFVLGTGGSSKAIGFVLKKYGIDFLQVSRTAGKGKITYPQIEANMKASNLFINATPLGMLPDIQSCPGIPYEKLSGNDFLFDLVYNPDETLFLHKGKVQGAKTKNGLEMLRLQADKSWKIWNSV